MKLQCFFWGFVSRCDKLWKTKGVGHGGQSFLIYIQSFLWWRGVFLNSWGFAKWQDSSLNMDLHGSWSELWGPASEKKKTFQSSCKRRGRGSHGWALNSRATPRNSNRTYLDHPRPSINGTFTVSFIYIYTHFHEYSEILVYDDFGGSKRFGNLANYASTRKRGGSWRKPWRLGNSAGNGWIWWIIHVDKTINHPWLGMVTIPPIKMIKNADWGTVYDCFTHINGKR